uniref:RING-type domain-containing protein n=1 Tax=Parastrongyloides trichosuri TaxID=131310 RepID=A0A0N4Z792_PARTI
MITGNCTICYEELSQNNVGALICGHTFCYTCISTWLDFNENKSSCPTCRTPLPSKKPIKLFFDYEESKDKGKKDGKVDDTKKKGDDVKKNEKVELFKWTKIFIKLLLHYVLIYHFLVPPVVCQHTNIRTEKERKKFVYEYHKYQKCLKENMYLDFKYGSRLFRAVTGLRGGGIELKCFECLNSADAERVEEAWKPNGNVLYRKFSKFKYGIKQMLKTDESLAAEDIHDDRWNYDWQIMKPGTKQRKWMPVQKATESSNALKNVYSMIKNFFTENAKFHYGDHFELEINGLNWHNVGFYRCINPLLPNVTSGEFYFVDVLNVQPVKFINADETDSLLESIKRVYNDQKVETYGKVSPWTLCDICDNKDSVQRQTIECHFRPIKGVSLLDLHDSDFSILQFFGEIPCSSTLVPVQYRPDVSHFKKYLRVKRCKLKCEEYTEEEIVQNIYGHDESGNRIIIDKVPPDEYTIQDRLPSLPPEVRRESFTKTEAEYMVLDCGYGDYGMYWKKETILLTDNILFDNYKGRVYINEKFQLVFEYTIMDDGGFYSCYSANSFLLSTHSVTMLQNSSTDEIIRVIRVVIKLGIVLLMVVLIMNAILKTKNRGDKTKEKKEVKEDNGNNNKGSDNDNNNI